LVDGDLESTHWCQLIVLKFKKTYASVEAIERQIEEQYCNAKEDNKDYGIKITSAGQTFVTFSPTFEYYSYRYCPEIPQLYSITNRDLVISLLETVKDKAIQCIDRVITNIQNYLECNGYINYEAQFSSDDNPKNILFKTANYPKEERTHVVQVTNSHIGYLNNYRLFLINEKLFDREIIVSVLNIIYHYLNKLTIISRIRSTNNGITYYYLGRKYIDKYDNVISKYKNQIAEALKDPFNKNILITGK